VIDIIQPVVRDKKRRVDQRQSGRRQQPVIQAAPGPVLRPGNQTGAQRVALDVATRPHQGVHRLNGNRLEPALIHRTFADGLPVLAPAHGVGSRYPVQELCELWGCHGTHDEMPVIRQHAVGYEPHRMLFEPGPQNVSKGPVVLALQEDGLAAGASVDDVKKAGERRGTRSSWHQGSLRLLATPMPCPAWLGGLAP
jgi:hypothetical protein